MVKEGMYRQNDYSKVADDDYNYEAGVMALGNEWWESVLRTSEEYLLAIDSRLIWKPRKLVSWILTTVQCREDFDSLLITGEQVERVEHVAGQQASTAVSPTPGSRRNLKTAKLGTFLKIFFWLGKGQNWPSPVLDWSWKRGRPEYRALAWHSIA